MIEKAKSHGLSINQYEDSAIDRMAVILSDIFQASVGVLTRRIKYDGLNQYLE